MLLFDLGGVLIDIDFRRAFRAWQPISSLSLDEISEAFQFDVYYERHERGEITASEYFDHLRSTLSLKGEHARIEEGWNSIYVAEIPETVALVQSARAQFSCNAFTNTNAAHQAAWLSLFPMIRNLFDRVFTSYELGYRKPEKQAFEQIAHALDVPLGSIMFFDDLLENIESAKSAGMQAVHVRSAGDVRNALRAIGCAL
jgi:epoxide hydrolase-like predicted phosphatase